MHISLIAQAGEARLLLISRQGVWEHVCSWADLAHTLRELASLTSLSDVDRAEFDPVEHLPWCGNV